MKYAAPIIIFLIIAFVGAYYLISGSAMQDTTTSNDEYVVQRMDSEMTAKMVSVPVNVDEASMDIQPDKMMMMEEKESFRYDYDGELADVTDGQTIRGISTDGMASGFAMFAYTPEDMFVMKATFEALPEPENGDFYEGWLVRREPVAFISKGELEMVDGQYVNLYQSETDYRDHEFYVLTLEPDDGDPAPADHIVEGVLLKKEASSFSLFFFSAV